MLKLDAIQHWYGRTLVVDGVTAEVSPGTVLTLVGPSGCGKTTLLNIAAGLVTPTAGSIENGFARSACVFQEPRLLPWRTLRDNIGFGMKALGHDARERAAVAERLVERLGLAGSSDRYPRQLSGGMRQRAALGRALAVEPDLLLLDEPFSALDIGLRRELQGLLLDLLADRNTAALFVTHDLAEALLLSDEVIVLSPTPGRVAHRLRPARPRGQRNDGSVYRELAELLDVPAVRAAFGLPAGSAEPPALARSGSFSGR